MNMSVCCITIGWLRREIDVGSFPHVDRRHMAGGTRHTRRKGQFLYRWGVVRGKCFSR